MLTWILLGSICWLLVRLIDTINHASHVHALAASGDAPSSGELLDHAGRPVVAAKDSSAIPPAIWLVAGIIYVICPLDFDFIPLIGWVDDAIVAYYAYQKWQQG